MIDSELKIRELLIASCHSSQGAKDYFNSRLNDTELLDLLVKIARDARDDAGDAPMQAAYWASQYPAALLVPHEAALFEMLPVVAGFAGHVALALGKTRSARGRNAIVQELGDGKRFDAWLFHKGIEAADRAE